MQKLAEELAKEWWRSLFSTALADYTRTVKNDALEAAAVDLAGWGEGSSISPAAIVRAHKS